jgi:Putative restriction endonuclease
LAIGVEQKRPDEDGRSSYVLWQDKILPILVLEVVSKTYNGEYDQKLKDYQALGILYYAIYNPFSGKRGLHEKRQALEVYKLKNGKYELIPSVLLLPKRGYMVWLSEIGLGIGYERGLQGDWGRNWLYWYDQEGVRYPTDAERALQAELAQQQAEAIAHQERQEKLQERQEKERLAAYLRSIGINPDEIP